MTRIGPGADRGPVPTGADRALGRLTGPPSLNVVSTTVAWHELAGLVWGHSEPRAVGGTVRFCPLLSVTEKEVQHVHRCRPVCVFNRPRVKQRRDQHSAEHRSSGPWIQNSFWRVGNLWPWTGAKEERFCSCDPSREGCRVHRCNIFLAFTVFQDIMATPMVCPVDTVTPTRCLKTCTVCSKTP